jgi:hypothetical protein
MGHREKFVALRSESEFYATLLVWVIMNALINHRPATPDQSRLDQHSKVGHDGPLRTPNHGAGERINVH